MTDGEGEHDPLRERSGVPDSVRVQILATEHWSLLATRSMLWNEAFSRAGMFLTVLSASVVALALVAQASDFGRTFRLFALLMLPVVLLLGWATYMRLNETSEVDIRLVAGMNRLRHGYLELAPDLETYFTTDHFDDEAGIVQSMTMQDPVGSPGSGPIMGIVSLLIGVASSTSLMVAILTAVVCGVFVGLIVDSLDGSTVLTVVAGLVATVLYAALTMLSHLRAFLRFRQTFQTRFARTP
jgi:hypothetical protein